MTTLILIYVYGTAFFALLGAMMLAGKRRILSEGAVGVTIVTNVLEGLAVAYLWIHSSFEYRHLLAVVLWATELVCIFDALGNVNQFVLYTRARIGFSLIMTAATVTLLSLLLFA